MWPLGYILESSYSPLLLEREMPGIMWRDAFEDLLALENGHGLVPNKTRRDESQLFKKLRHEEAKRRHTMYRDKFNELEGYLSFLQKWRSRAIQLNSKDLIEAAERDIKPVLNNINDLAARSEENIEIANAIHDASPDSRLKPRALWITSLIANGAMSGWSSTVSNSSAMHYHAVHKDDDPEVGQVFTEVDLDRRFDEKIPFSPDVPDWSTQDDPYPNDFGFFGMEDLVTISMKGSTLEPISLKGSILKQTVGAVFFPPERRPNGFRLTLTNHYVDGNDEEKMLGNDISELWHEIFKARWDMEEYHDALYSARNRWMAKYSQDVAKVHEEFLADQESYDG